MKILQVNVQDEYGYADAVIKLSRAEIGTINKLMNQVGQKGSIRAQFFLLYELISHGSFDRFDMEQAQRIMEDKEGEADNG